MNDCYLNFLVSFRALFSLDVGANLVNSKQTIGIILPDLSLLGYAVPVESFGIGLFVILFTYLIIEYNVQLLSHEKFKIAMNMLHTAHTPLILLRNQLEELKTGNLPEPLSQQVEEALGYAECIIYCNRNIATLNKVNKRIPPKTSTVNLELSTYVTSIVNQCRAHANSRQIRLTVGECSDCVSCRINENIMTAALQHLINKMILISESGCCISINVTHTMNSWQLQISNNEIAGQRAGKMFPFIPIIFPVYGYSDLWTVRKIIRLHGGKITGCRHGKAATFQIVIPTDCHCQNQSCPVLKHSSAKTKTQIDDSCESPKSDKQYGEDKTTFYSEAAKEFGDVIDGKYGTYDLTKNYADNFDVAHENNEESILEFQFLGDVDNAGFNPGLATSGLAFDSRGLMLPGAGVGYEGVVHNWLYNAFVNSVDKDGYTDIRMFSTMIFNDLDASIHLRNDAGGNPVRLEGPGGYKWEELYPAKNGKEGFATVSNPLAHSFKAGIRKGIDCSMPTQTEADGTPKLVGVGAGVKEYVYNQPRAHGVNWRYIRYADVLMMYAEAVVSGGTQASNMTPLQAVNKVRGRANMSELPSVTMTDIQNERILEFALEGHRFYDLLRWGKLTSRFTELQESDPNFKKFISADDFKGFVTNKHEWLPIPINEVNSNPYITENNPGY